MSARRRLVAAAAAVGGSAALAALAIPAGAHPRPATVAVNLGCYQTAERGKLTGSGFDPTSDWTAKLDGKPFGRGTTTKTGTITATFGVPSHLLKGSKGEDSYKLVVRQGKHSATATFLVTHLSASFSPQSGDVLTLKVAFKMLGWGRGASMYLHYVTPKGTDRMDRALGGAGGACGHLTTTPAKLFPFVPSKGKWTLQFDKSRKYLATTKPRVTIYYRIS